MNKFEEKVQTFWRKVQLEYAGFVKEGGVAEKRDYYVFQTGYHHNPDLMIVGINPGGDRKNGDYWLCTEDSYNSYVKGDHAWFQTLRNIFGYPQNTVLKPYFENCVGTNKVFINTGSIEKLPKDVDSTSTKLIRELVRDIIQPKHIIALGKAPFDSLQVSDLKVKKFGSVNLKYGYSQGTPICFIPNPSPINSKYNNERTYTDWQEAIEWFMKL